jgi:PAS domain S-box-containing protein
MPDDGDLLNAICSSPIATVVTNPRSADNPIVAVNPAFERLTGYAHSQVIGRNCRFLAGLDTEQEGSQLLREAVRDARPVLVELLNYKADGSPFRNAVMVAPLFDAGGRLVYFVGSQMEVPISAGLPATRSRDARLLVDKLTPRQRQVLREMMLGYRNKQIAARLALSEKTVKMHRSALLGKLQAVSSTDAVRIAVEAGL